METDEFKRHFIEQLKVMLVENMVSAIASTLELYATGVDAECYRKMCDLIGDTHLGESIRKNPKYIDKFFDKEGYFDIRKFSQQEKAIFEGMLDILDEDNLFPGEKSMNQSNDEQFEAINVDFDAMAKKFTREWEACNRPAPLADAAKKTLILKIRVKAITKPPVWRLVSVPANFNFKQLHQVIQAVFGWDDFHLWQFQEKAYDSPFAITDDGEEFMDGTSVVFDPATTYHTSYFRKSNDKLEYAYDYGDDWICEITTQEIADVPSKKAKLLKRNGDMLPEDVGGPYAYMELRDAYNKRDRHTNRQKNEAA